MRHPIAFLGQSFPHLHVPSPTVPAGKDLPLTGWDWQEKAGRTWCQIWREFIFWSVTHRPALARMTAKWANLSFQRMSSILMCSPDCEPVSRSSTGIFMMLYSCRQIHIDQNQQNGSFGLLTNLHCVFPPLQSKQYIFNIHGDFKIQKPLQMSLHR